MLLKTLLKHTKTYIKLPVNTERIRCPTFPCVIQLLWQHVNTLLSIPQVSVCKRQCEMAQPLFVCPMTQIFALPIEDSCLPLGAWAKLSG